MKKSRVRSVYLEYVKSDMSPTVWHRILSSHICTEVHASAYVMWNDSNVTHRRQAFNYNGMQILCFLWIIPVTMDQCHHLCKYQKQVKLLLFSFLLWRILWIRMVCSNMLSNTLKVRYSLFLVSDLWGSRTNWTKYVQCAMSLVFYMDYRIMTWQSLNTISGFMLSLQIRFGVCYEVGELIYW